MGILEWFFGSRIPADPPRLETAVGLTPTRTRAASAAFHLELLDALSCQPVDEAFRGRWSGHIDSVDDSIARFVSEGLLAKAGPARGIEYRHTAAELKALCREHGIKSGGKRKPELAEALAKALPAEAAEQLVGDLLLYEATPAGREKIEALRTEKQRGRENMESGASELLATGDVEGAARLIARYEFSQPFPRGLGVDWSSGMPPAQLEHALWLVRHSYDDLHLPIEKRRQIGTQLALWELLGEPMRDAAARVLAVAGQDFGCQSLQEFLRSSPCGGYASGMDPDSPRDLAELYAHTRIFEASSISRLKEIRTERLGKGIELFGGEDDTCRICSGGKFKYRWSELDRLPAVPRHWGCRCLYMPWLE